MNKWNSINEAAKKLGVSRQVLNRIIKAGQIEYTVFLKTKKISDDQIENFIKNQTVIKK